MEFNFKTTAPHILAVLFFIIISVGYFLPVIKGKQLQQSDLTQYIGMSKQQTDFRNKTQIEPYWTDRCFAGMPTYQLGAQYPYHYIKKLSKIIRFLPHPANYLFLYLIGFYILMICCNIDQRLAILGSVAFAFSVYYIIILGVGHNAKAHAIGYMPIVVGGALLIFKNKLNIGGILYTIGMALELVANHFQMTYYLGFLIGGITIGYAYQQIIKKKEIKIFLKQLSYIFIGTILALGLNATSILATKEYTNYSTRGKRILEETNKVIKKKNNNGLDYDYITEYSYGILESMNLCVARFMGGASSESLNKEANLYQYLRRIGVPFQDSLGIVKHAPTYWGDQTYVAAPAYIGSIIVFLALFYFIYISGLEKRIFASVCALVLLLSWGRNFEILTRLFINYVPLYNKFRAVASIQVILELCLPLCAVLGLQKLLFPKEQKNNGKILAQLQKTAIILIGIIGIAYVGSIAFLSFNSNADMYWAKQLGGDFFSVIAQDRKDLMTTDCLKSIFFIIATYCIIWAFYNERLKINQTILAIGILICVDLIPTNWRYVNHSQFISKSENMNPFKPSELDKQILEDKTHFRVLDFRNNPFNSSRTSYFHNSIGGYHGAKPRRIQDIYDHYIISNQATTNIIDLFNIKYLIYPNQEKGEELQYNEENLGNSWFIDTIKTLKNDTEVFKALENANFQQEVFITENEKVKIPNIKDNYNKSTLAHITLSKQQPNQLEYQSSNSHDGFAVFSEIYYTGWNAYIDGKKVDHQMVNYTFRGMFIPKGKHEIIFKFEPKIIRTGTNITLLFSIITLLGIGYLLYLEFFRKNIEYQKTS